MRVLRHTPKLDAATDSPPVTDDAQNRCPQGDSGVHVIVNFPLASPGNAAQQAEPAVCTVPLPGTPGVMRTSGSPGWSGPLVTT